MRVVSSQSCKRAKLSCMRRRPVQFAILCLTLLCLALPCSAAAAQSCLVDHGSACKLDGMLNILYAIAVLLGLLLLVVGALAVHMWRKNRSSVIDA